MRCSQADFQQDPKKKKPPLNLNDGGRRLEGGGPLLALFVLDHVQLHVPTASQKMLTTVVRLRAPIAASLPRQILVYQAVREH